VDTCGFPKGQAYFFRSAWSNEPVVRVLVIDPELEIDPVAPYWFSPPYVSHWNFSGRATQTLIVHTPSNCDTVELLLNGHSLGTQRPADSPNQTIVWYVPNLPGTLVAIGRNNGDLVAGHGVRTSGAPAGIQLRPDRASLKADGQDLSHIEVSIVDSEGITVPDSDTLITFEVNGGGKLAAVDDGRLRSLESYQGNTRLTRLGKCLLVVRAGRQAGRIAITATGGSLPSASIELDVHS
jgi:beta-galactosidase